MYVHDAPAASHMAYSAAAATRRISSRLVQQSSDVVAEC